MQSPSLFDDVYDSEINIDYYDYHKYRLLEYCRRCGLPADESKTIENIGIELLKAIQESVEKNKDFDHIFTGAPTSEIESMSNEIFINKIKIGLPITLEGPDYKLSGTVSDIDVVDAKDNEVINKNMNTTDDVQ